MSEDHGASDELSAGDELHAGGTGGTGDAEDHADAGSERVPVRVLGKTGLRVGAIGLGTVKLGRTRGLKYAGVPALPSDEQALELLRAARELGVNLIDTAPAYGVSERRLGELLPRVAPREDWVLCTKVGEVFDDATGAGHYDFTPGHIRASVERSLLSLKSDVLDVVLLHFASSTELDAQVLERGEAVGVLRELQAKGLVRAVGASVGTPQGGALAAGVCDVVMLTLSAGGVSDGAGGGVSGGVGGGVSGELTGDVRSLTAASLHRAGVLAKKPLDSGRAADPGATVRALLSDARVHCAVVGTSNPRNLRQLAAALRFGEQDQ